MNRYGHQAKRHWQDTRASQVKDLTDPESFFTQLGEDLEQAIEELEHKLAGDPPPEETYLQRVQRLTMARSEAESRVLRGILLTAEEHVRQS